MAFRCEILFVLNLFEINFENKNLSPKIWKTFGILLWRGHWFMCATTNDIRICILFSRLIVMGMPVAKAAVWNFDQKSSSQTTRKWIRTEMLAKCFTQNSSLMGCSALKTTTPMVNLGDGVVLHL